MLLHKPESGARDATGLPRGGSRWLLHKAEFWDQGCHRLAPWRFTLAANRRIAVPTKLAAIVNLHGPSPWHLARRNAIVVANIVNLQRDKPVASSEFSQGFLREWV